MTSRMFDHTGKSLRMTCDKESVVFAICDTRGTVVADIKLGHTRLNQIVNFLLLTDGSSWHQDLDDAMAEAIDDLRVINKIDDILRRKQRRIT